MKAKRKIFIALGSVTILTLLFLAAVVYPVFQGVVADHGKVLAFRQELVQLEHDTRNSRSFETLSSQYAQEFAKLEDIFVDSKTPVVFFRFLDDTAAAFNLQMDKSPGSVQQGKEDRWPSFEIRLTGQGLYEDVAAFLQKIEAGPYLLEVKSLALSARTNPDAPESASEVTFSLSLKVFAK